LRELSRDCVRRTRWFGVNTDRSLAGADTCLGSLGRITITGTPYHVL
jgi:hypothetical protein